MKLLQLFVLLFLCLSGYSQDTLDLFRCYSLAEANSPISCQMGLYESVNSLKHKNISTNYYPKLNLSGKATYQSDVTEVQMVMPTIPGIGQLPSPETSSMPKDQYDLSVNINQIFYDGGLSKILKESADAKLKIDQQKVNVELYGIKEKINAFYFGILVCNETYSQISISIDNLREQENMIRSGIKNGIMQESDLDLIMAEVLKMEQKQLEIETARLKMLRSLSDHIGISIDTGDVLSVPQVEVVNGSLQRPENILFDLTKSQLDVSSKLISKKRMPVLYGFGQVGYGRPGLNMLNDSFDSYYMVGAKLSWDICDWNKTKRERENIQIAKKIIDTKQEDFNKNINIAIENIMLDIEKYEKMIAKDEEVVSLRQRITKKSASQLKNGVINSTEYITELNREMIDRISLAMHKIELVQLKVNYQTIKGF